jgi:hypothetical protein
MPRIAILAIVIALRVDGVLAQEEPAAIDFMLRPTQDAAENDTWSTTGGPEEPAILGSIGLPLAGPTGAEDVGLPLAGPNPAPSEVPARQGTPRNDDPFAATGMRLGSFILRPAIEFGVSASDNPAETSDGDGAIGALIAPELNISSEDELYAVEADLRGAAILYGDDELDEREAEATVRARYELTESASLDAALRYTYDLDRYSDPDTPAAAIERPPVHDLFSSLGFAQRFGRLSLGAAGEVERSIHEDVDLSGGGTASREELDNTEYGLRLRAAYEATPALSPFAEVAAGRREFDQQLDDSGFARSSDWGELRGGILVDFGDKLSGEAALGYRFEDLDDDRLDDIDAVVASAAILWSPRRLTDVRFELSTDVQPTSVADSSGSVLYSGTLSVARRLGARFRIEAGGGLDHERFVGIDRRDDTWFGYGEFGYALSRYASLTARYGYETTLSTDDSVESDEHVVSVRVRLQH